MLYFSPLIPQPTVGKATFIMPLGGQGKNLSVKHRLCWGEGMSEDFFMKMWTKVTLIDMQEPQPANY